MKKKLEIKISEKALRKFAQIEEECLKNHNGPLAVSPIKPKKPKKN